MFPSVIGSPDAWGTSRPGLVDDLIAERNALGTNKQALLRRASLDHYDLRVIAPPPTTPSAPMRWFVTFINNFGHWYQNAFAGNIKLAVQFVTFLPCLITLAARFVPLDPQLFDQRLVGSRRRFGHGRPTRCACRLGLLIRFGRLRQALPIRTLTLGIRHGTVTCRRTANHCDPYFVTLRKAYSVQYPNAMVG
jgi:hypothetical protein